MKSKEQFMNQLIEETTNLIVDNNIELVEALDEENYEKAAQMRDLLEFIIDDSANIFASVSDGSLQMFTQHFREQSKFVFDELNKRK